MSDISVSPSGIGGSLFNLGFGIYDRIFQDKEAKRNQDNFDRQMAMANDLNHNKYSYMVQDMERAGLNKLLAAGQPATPTVAGQSTPGRSLPNPDVSGPMLQAAQLEIERKQANAASNNLNAQASYYNALANNTRGQFNHDFNLKAIDAAIEYARINATLEGITTNAQLERVNQWLKQSEITNALIMHTQTMTVEQWRNLSEDEKWRKALDVTKSLTDKEIQEIQYNMDVHTRDKIIDAVKGLMQAFIISRTGEYIYEQKNPPPPPPRIGF